MSTDKAPASSIAAPSLSDYAARINSEFAAIQKTDHDANKTVVQRAVAFGRTLTQAKEKVGHGKWEKWLNDNCRAISKRTAQRYMMLADSEAVRKELGKNDTVSFMSLRAALALANRRPPKPKQPSDEYDRAETTLVEKLEALSPDTAEAAVNETEARIGFALSFSAQPSSEGDFSDKALLPCPVGPNFHAKIIETSGEGSAYVVLLASYPCGSKSLISQIK